MLLLGIITTKKMYQLRRCETLYQKVLQVSHRHGAPLRSLAPVTHLQLPATGSSYRHLSLVTSISVRDNMTPMVVLGQSANVRHHHSTSVVSKDSKPEETPAPTQEAQSATAQDEVPVWQNPLHHNNPAMEKMFEEDFQEGETMVPSPMPPFETDPSKAVAPPHIHDLAHRIVNLTLLELKELTDRIAQHFDFDDSVMAASYSGGSAVGAAAAAPQEEQPEQKVIFDLKLVGFDEKAKIKVIKEIRAIAGLGLKEAKELVEAAPKIFQKDLKQERAEELKAQLEAVGAQVEIV